ncbi:MAG TPA: hypothetical protein PKO22_02820 [Treponemataceae bacterium]|nr:hypothetical protein [Treponemataceae bacterium]
MSNRLAISHIRIGFQGVVLNGNYMDCHQALKPFGLCWGRGILIHSNSGLDAITCTCVDTHSRLKQDLLEDETTAGAFYYGYMRATRTLYLEYASDNMFNFLDEGVLPAIMYAIGAGSGPLKNYVLIRDKAQTGPEVNHGNKR